MGIKRNIIYLAALSCLVSCGAEARLGTFNLWRSDIGKGEYSWQNRKEILAQAIVDNDFDIFAAEEVDTTMFRELPSIVGAKGGRYEWFTFSPYAADGSGSMKAQAIVYKSDRFELLESHHFWCSETPDVISTGWDEGKFKRGACCATFKDRKTGRKLFVMISHFPLGKEARLHFAPIVIERAKMYNPENLPSFLMGDLNTRYNRPESEILRSYWTDAFDGAEGREGPEGTFNNHGLYEDMEKAPKIDFVYYRGDGVKALKYVCNPVQYNGIYPSDHCPVYVDFKIK